MLKRSLLNQFRRRLHVESFDSKFIILSDVDAADPSRSVHFRNLFLRDACPSRVDKSTHQKDFSTAQLDTDVFAKDARVINDGTTLSVDWIDGHSSQFSEKLLKRYATPLAQRQFRKLSATELNIWNRPRFENIFSVPNSDYMNSKLALSETLRQLNKEGLVLITGVHRPEADKTNEPVESIAQRIGYIKDTFYGRSWDVKSVPNAKNVAYTDVYLPLHMDLLYYESPPGVQLLHVIDNTAVGGESVFADSFAAALHVLEKDPQAYDALTRIPLTFHYLHTSDHYYYQRPLIVENKFAPIDATTGRRPIDHVNYSPPFQGPIDALACLGETSDVDVELFMRGFKLFEEFIEDPSNQIERFMPEGTCMIFMNRRILHGRRQFQAAAGKRFFKGTYLDIDAFQSKLRVITACEK